MVNVINVFRPFNARIILIIFFENEIALKGRASRVINDIALSLNINER